MQLFKKESVVVCLLCFTAALSSILKFAPPLKWLLYTQYRLPTTVIPLNYMLKIIPCIKQELLFSRGQLTTRIKCLQNTNKIVFNAKDINVEYANINTLLDSRSFQIDNITENKKSETLTLKVWPALTNDTEYLLHLHFKSPVGESMLGFYRSTYLDKSSNSPRWLGVTQFSPTEARRVFPCWDEPQYKVPFTLTIARPEGFTALSNMPKLTSMPMLDHVDWYWDTFVPTPPMPTFSLAWVVSDFESSTLLENKNYNVQIWARENAMPNLTYLSGLVIDLVGHMEDYFMFKYPLPKLDLVAVPDFGYHAMENWGLITFKETSLLINEGDTDYESLRSGSETISHELCHQWFGNLVTPSWWDDLWLKEGFATYFGLAALDKLKPDEKYMELWLASNVQAMMISDSLASTKRIVGDRVRSRSDISQMFDEIAYIKGAAVLRMIESMIGKERFRNGLTYFLHQHQFKSVNRTDLWQSVISSTNDLRSNPTYISSNQVLLDWKYDRNVAENPPEENLSPSILLHRFYLIVTSWIENTGYPLVTVTRNYTDGSFTLEQERWVMSKELSKSNFPNYTERWPFILSYTREGIRSGNNISHVWVEPTEKITKVQADISNSEWLLVNHNFMSLCRVNYDDLNWFKLSENFLSFDGSVQSQLLADSFALAFGQRLDYRTPLKMVVRLGQDSAAAAWVTALRELHNIELRLRNSRLHSYFKEWLKNFLKGEVSLKMLVQSSRSPDKGDQMDKLQNLISLKRLRLAVNIGDTEVLNQAKFLVADAVINNSSLNISTDLEGVVLCAAEAAAGNSDDTMVWDWLWKRYSNSDCMQTKKMLLQAITCSANHKRLSRFLMTLLDNNPNIRKQEGATIIKALATNPYCDHAALDFLISKYKNISKHYGAGFNKMNEILKSFTHLNTETYYEKINSLYNKIIMDQPSSDGFSPSGFHKVQESIKMNIAWLKASEPQLMSFLGKMKY